VRFDQFLEAEKRIAIINVQTQERTEVQVEAEMPVSRGILTTHCRTETQLVKEKLSEISSSEHPLRLPEGVELLIHQEAENARPIFNLIYPTDPK
jgi:hypothetical protein